MLKLFLISATSLFTLLSCGQNRVTPGAKWSPVETIHTFSWGKSTTKISVLRYGDSTNPVMINLHDDEATSVRAAKRILEQSGGFLIRVVNNKKRMISFSKNGKKWIFDPNRMFTRTGIIASLQRNNQAAPEPIIASITDFAQFVLDQIPRHSNTLIALHNNDQGKLSIDSYMPGGAHEQDAAFHYKSRSLDPDNFYLTTDENLYRQLQSQQLNVVQQDNVYAKDDGSLSIYYGRKKKSYINVEAEHGQVMEQQDMIRRVVSILSDQKLE